MKTGAWISVAIVALALVLRLALLGLKPAHFDEGVNGWFVDQMTHNGFYRYDPTNFHGPLHFYVLFVAQSLLGRHEWALRLPLALVSTACVALMLGFRAFLGANVCRIAALCMAVSPAFVFYGRYAIHESWFVLFVLLTAWGLAGLHHFGDRRSLWATAAGLTGMILTKETYIIHIIAFASAYGVLLWWERHSPSAALAPARQQWKTEDLVATVGVSIGALLLFYSGFLLDFASLGGLFVSLFAWAHTGVAGQTGHEKEPWYWLDLMVRYEWPALVGVAASLGLAFRGGLRVLRWLALAGAASLFAYSIVAYKTPWCIVTVLWPFYFVFGAAVVFAAQRFDRWVVGVAAAVIVAVSAVTSFQLNFHHYTDESEPYVYVQTRLDIDKLLVPLRTLAARDPMNWHLPGYVAMGDVHPLPWLLGDFTHVHVGNLTELPRNPSDGVFFLVSEEYQAEIERTLTGAWFREKITVRGNSGQSQFLYLRPDIFGEFCPGREPEFAGKEAL